MSEQIKRAIVTGGTKDDVAPMAVFAINISRTNAALFDELVILHDGIKAKDQKLINSIFPTRFIKYEYPHKSRNDEVLSYFSEMVFCKYECFRLLNDYDEVVWSDYDVVILGPIHDFCMMNESSFHVLTTDTSTREMFYKNIESDEILGYDLNKDGVGTPLFIINRSVGNYNKICDWCYQKTSEWDKDLYLPEQCIFSLATQEFNISLKRYDFNTYACYPTNYTGKELIIHAAGQPKFWNGLNNDTWDGLYHEWLDLGGSKVNNGTKRLKRMIKFVTTRVKGIRGKMHY